MPKKKVLPYRNFGTEENPIWEEYYTITIADAVLLKDGSDITIDEKINSIDDTIYSYQELIDQNTDEINKLKTAVDITIINGGNATN